MKNLKFQSSSVKTIYGMSIIEKVFHYEESEISVIKCKDDIWFRGKDIAKALGYSILKMKPTFTLKSFLS